MRLAVALLLVSTPAFAKPYTHDGFYLSVSLGIGYEWTTFSYDEPNADRGWESDSTIPTSLFIGGSLTPSFVLGGGVLLDVQTADYYPEAFPDGIRTIGGYGIFGDYFVPAAPGLHVQGFVGLGGTKTYNLETSEEDGAVLMLGAGYEVWVARELSVGALVRFTYTFAQRGSDPPQQVHTLAPALLATLTWQ